MKAEASPPRQARAHEFRRARTWALRASSALAVAADVQGCGVGADLMRRALREANRRGYRAVLLVGDPAYYQRFGFSAENTGALRMPGPYERERLLAHEFEAGALSGTRGMIAADRPRSSRLEFISHDPSLQFGSLNHCYSEARTVELAGSR